MTDIFLSCKREDEGRVALLVRALEGAGLSVWWDRALPGGEDWRSRIQAALDAAKIVIVCWSRASVGPEGGFVRDEAARAIGPALLRAGFAERDDADFVAPEGVDKRAERAVDAQERDDAVLFAMGLHPQFEGGFKVKMRGYRK